MSAAPIFIVGLPRSGTTLLAAMLAAHPAIDCGPETFFFARLPRDLTRLTDPATWPGPALVYLCSLRLRDALVHEMYGRTRADMERHLTGRPPSLAVMLEALTAARAAALGKRRWVEKTPRHLGRLRLIRATFPDAAVVRLVRDPRDTALSLTRVPFASDSLLVNLDAVARSDRAAESAARTDPWLLTVRYEDLVLSPEQVLRAVCEFVAEAFDPRMLKPREGAAGLAAAHEWWKGKESGPLDPSRVEAWRREMGATDQRIAAVICHDMIERHGYPEAVLPRTIVAIEPDAPGFIARDERTARRLALGRVVVRPRSAGGGATASSSGPRGAVDLVYWPADGRDPWRLGRTRKRRARSLARMAFLLARRRMTRRPATWVRAPRDPRPRVGTRAAELTLRALARPMAPEAWLRSKGVADREADDPVVR